MSASGLKLYFLGSPRIEFDDQLVELHLQKGIALLSFLVITGQIHRRDTLATFLWPDYSQQKARSYLRNALWVLKEALGESWFVIHREEIGLNPAKSIWVDVTIFQQHLKAVEIHRILHPGRDLCQVCADRLVEAVNLHQDDFLTGFTLPDSPAFDEWQFYLSEDLRQRLYGALEQLARWYTLQGTVPVSIRYLKRWILLDPFNDSARQLLMEAYLWAGQLNSALGQYQEYAQTLQQELKTSPSNEISELYQSIKNGHTGLKDAFRPAAEKKKGADKSPQTGVFSATPAGVSAQIPWVTPIPLTFPQEHPFIRREDELIKLDSLLKKAVLGQGKTAFISGRPGSGKTALVVEFATRAQETCSDLIVVGGTCNPQTGLMDPYIIFREILNLLVGEVEMRWAGGMLTAENLNRLFAFLPTVLQVLVDHAPDLIGSFLPQLNLSSKVWAFEKLDPRISNFLIKVFMMDFHKNRSKLDQGQLVKQYCMMLEELSAQKPLLLILDDLHWAGPSSNYLLSHLCKHLGDQRILILATYCPQDLEPNKQGHEHSLIRLLDDFAPPDIPLSIDLDRTIRLDGPVFVKAWIDHEPNRLSEKFKQDLSKITGGNPLFLSGYLQAMKEQGVLHLDDQGYWEKMDSISGENPPECLEEVIETIISRLPEKIRLVLEAACVEGCEFTVEVIASVLGLDRMELIRILNHELDRYHLIAPLSLHQSGPHRLTKFRFCHSLYQKCLYDHLDQVERAHYHKAIGENLEQIYNDQADQISIQLAWHFERAGNLDKTVEYLKMAGRRARRIGADREAAWFFQHGSGVVNDR